MATQVWSGGAGDGNFATAGNWVSGVAPGNGDTAIINSTNSNILGTATGFTTITLIVTSGYGGIIGSDGNALTFGSITALTYAGRGAAARLGCAGTVAAAYFHHSSFASVFISTGTWTLIENSAGQMDIAAAAPLVTLRNTSGTITIGYNATAITALTSGGPVTCKRNITTANLERAQLTHQDNGVTTYTLCTTVNVHNGATYNKQSGGTDTTLTVFPGGAFTIVGSSGGAAASVTVTTSNIWAGNAGFMDAVPGLTLTTTKAYVGADTGARP